MSDAGGKKSCSQIERAAAFAIGALPLQELRAVETHIETCLICQDEVGSLRRVVTSLPSWPADILHAPSSLWDRLAARVADEAITLPLVASPMLDEPAWEPVAAGISCKLLALDRATERVSMLVRLDPGSEYPPHVHADTEELYLLDGELWINERRLIPGDYHWAEPDTVDRHVSSQTGCTCVLITSMRDRLIY